LYDIDIVWKEKPMGSQGINERIVVPSVGQRPLKVSKWATSWQVDMSEDVAAIAGGLQDACSSPSCDEKNKKTCDFLKLWATS